VGRPKKVRGRLFEGLRGEKVRVVEGWSKWAPFVGKAPRGKTGHAWDFTSFLKERVPLVYAFTVDELGRSVITRNPALQEIIEKWRREEDPPARRTPSARVLTAYIVERAMAEAWEVWGVKRPYSQADHDAFFRRYVHGHPGALHTFRTALRQPTPWDRHHVGHELKWFLGKPGEAARHYGFLERRAKRFCVVILERE
jgi:hypothetical protein